MITIPSAEYNKGLRFMEKGKVVTFRFDRKKDPYKLSKDILIVRKNMEYRDNGLLYESLFPTGIKYHPDIYYDFDSYMWRAMLPDGELCQGDLRSMVRMFTGTDIVYHYEVDGEEKQARVFEAVVRDAVENPESFSIMGFQDDYSLQEWKLLLNLCEKLNTCRNGERYSGAKLEQWISG